MVTGELKSKIDSLWEIFWTGGEEITSVQQALIEALNYQTPGSVRLPGAFFTPGTSAAVRSDHSICKRDRNRLR